MALTALEQLELVNGTSGASPDATDLRTLVKASAYIYATGFYDSYTEFDGDANPEAQRYLDKMFSVCRNVYRNRGDQELTRIIITIIGRQVTNLAQVQGATDAQWESFVSTYIEESFEKLADVRKDEKTAYDAL